MINHELIAEIEQSKKDFDKLMDKLIKNLKREEKILRLSDKRQRKEYDELQKKYEEVKKLQEAQEKLIDSFIKIIASAIDAKSKYIGAHCERVPILTAMLTKEVSESDEIDFKIENEDQEKEISTAAWLHDCGKIVTPDFVMNKSVKLETLYNRIHEIRTRFEVLYRDLIIEAMKRKMNGEDEKKVDKWLDEELKKLKEDFEFLAKINNSKQELTEEEIQRIKEIADREWYRYFDDTLGLSEDELSRVPESEKNQKLPVKEKLLADKKRHIVKRSKREINDLKRHNFHMEIPKNMYNYGEIYNLTIPRGTLTPEEYFKIQEHVIMTIKMLESLPFPERFKNVPLYAGAHHEAINGKGYPRRLKGDEIPIPARIMAIADIFEALTAKDRPYKDKKTLSQAIDILVQKALEGELDKDILAIFIKSRVFEKYAKMFLSKDQIDEVDVDYYLKKLKGN